MMLEMATYLDGKHNVEFVPGLVDGLLIIPTDVDQPAREVRKRIDACLFGDPDELIHGHNVRNGKVLVVLVKIVPDCRVGETREVLRDARRLLCLSYRICRGATRFGDPFVVKILLPGISMLKMWYTENVFVYPNDTL